MVNAAMFGALRRHGEQCVLWSIQPEGLRPVSAAEQVREVLRRAHPGAIVDLHDAEGTRGAPVRLVAALAPVIDGLREMGYELVTVGELLEGRDASLADAAAPGDGVGRVVAMPTTAGEPGTARTRRPRRGGGGRPRRPSPSP
jgi:hypothetical protein